ncbi:MAG: response regulator [Deltaproteobacteria bacterium]|nr:response regulator [Deltaproteobacteria bacterium]
MTARVLIIEDSRDYAENLAELLGDEGYDVELVSKMRDALERARHDGFDIALLDVRLPDAIGTDGLVALRALAPSSEVIVMSGDATLDSAIAAVRGGAMAYLLKPAPPDELLHLVAMAAKQVGLRRERELLLKRLATSEARYRGLVETSAALVLGFDAAGAIVLFNAACESATGYARDSMLGQPVHVILAQHGGESSIVGAFDGNRPIRTRSGAERQILWRQTVIDGVTYAFGIDRTEQVELEHRAHAAERLAAAGQLTAGLAHEVRNPLNAALLQLKVHERSLARAGVTAGLESVAAVRIELERLRRLTDDFLELARPRRPEPVVGDLREAAESVRRWVSTEALERGIEIQLDVGDEPVTATFDESRVRQVLLNLVRNAFDVLPPGGHVVIRTRRTPGIARVEVEDDGPGIAHDLEQVFNPFFTTKATGTGLGLAIARRIVADHRGELRVSSTPGRTIFTMSLPA